MAKSVEIEFRDGYEHGRWLCLTHDPITARRWLAEHPEKSPAFLEGAYAGLWDYLDANGLGADFGVA